ncbi:uncharacterized protein LOC111028782 [Myzus persicae]|uniref:uncharacterized protein LOC111026208 n=1 Tax=Myzus persicae TaxID=13164 RepID=UPI000B938C4E|nr:uncharacterized protein LOC111026208 [Myzus persicae]XP_022163229.1 uncharacterized protein LOC111028782 [Myzus persicae]
MFWNVMLTSGIKDVCVWHDVCGFNVLDQSGMDIMHDLLEGVCKFDMAFLLNYYIYELKIFSLQILNERMIHFDYGPDSSSKPPVLNVENIHKNYIRLSASEMLVLVRYFGLIIGDFVPINDPVWHLYILLRQILDLVTSLSLQIDSCELLQILIAEHHDLYLKFSRQHLKPKHHFMLHYHTMLKKFGPLIALWSMRFEAKHRISKIAANTTSNRRNICKTLAIKHQLQLNNLFFKGSLPSHFETGPPNILSDLELEVLKKCLQLNSVKSIVKCPWVSIKGTKYKPKLVLTLDIYENNLPIFGIIEDIVVLNDILIIFKCKRTNTVIFDDHVFSYEIKLDDECTFVYHHALLSYIPNNISVLPNGRSYVTLRSSI